MRPLAERKGLRIRVTPLRDPIALNTDPRKVRQITINMLANAVKFTESGEVSVVVRLAGRGTDVLAHIEVSDTGRGIALADQPHVFEPFWRGDPTSPNTDGSTGLGLAVARQLTRLLGGDLVVTCSSPGKGSAFTASFPAFYQGEPDGDGGR